MLAPPRHPLPQTGDVEALEDALAAQLSLPIALTSQLRLSPEQFAELCAANPDAVLELAADGALILMTPTGSETEIGRAHV